MDSNWLGELALEGMVLGYLGVEVGTLMMAMVLKSEHNPHDQY